MKKVLALVFIAAIFFACGNKNQEPEEVVPMKVSEVVSQLEALVDSNIVIEGTVSHVCMHGGKKMFIYGDNPEEDLKVIVSDDVTVFDQALVEGEVVLEGMIVVDLKIDEAYLADWEAKTMTAMAEDSVKAAEEATEVVAEEVTEEAVEEHAEGDHDHGHVTTMKEHHMQYQETLDKIAEYRAELAEKGVDFIPKYAFKCTKVTEKVAEGDEDVDEEGDIDEEDDNDHE